jgi:hypothetical protein
MADTAAKDSTIQREEKRRGEALYTRDLHSKTPSPKEHPHMLRKLLQ